jgi:branched-chain amino acid transport system substrate-binding protein
MTKKIIWIIIAAIVVILVAWGITRNTDNVSGEKIKVGAVLPLSGATAYFGEEMKKGMEMCNPGNLEYVFEDSVGTPQQGISAYNKLTRIDKADVTVVGMSTVVPAILPIAKENKDFVITTIVTAADVGKNGGDTVFRYYIDGAVIGEIIANSMLKKDVKKVGVLYVQNEYGETYKNGAVDFLNSKSILVYPESFLATDTDFSTAILKLKQQGVDSVLVVAYDKQTLQIVSKIKDSNLGVDIYNAWMWSDADLAKNTKILEGVIMPRSEYLFGSSDKTMKFDQEFKAKFGVQSNQYGSIGCDLSKLIGENNINTAEKLSNLKKFSGVNGEITQAENGEFYFPVKMIQYIGGKTAVL